jgi:PLP dependent protein
LAIDRLAYEQIKSELDAKNVTLVAVSKTKPVEDILALYDLGHRDFGENYVQELTEKAEKLPQDIRWHFIGHLQSNKVKQIASFVHLIHGVDSLNLLKEINKQGAKINRVINILLQVHIAEEETKFGLSETELEEVKKYSANLDVRNIKVRGLMGMASFTEDMNKVRQEFQLLRRLLEELRLPISDYDAPILSMGMSADYKVAIEEGSNMVRIGSLLFGARN